MYPFPQLTFPLARGWYIARAMTATNECMRATIAKGLDSPAVHPYADGMSSNPNRKAHDMIRTDSTRNPLPPLNVPTSALPPAHVSYANDLRAQAARARFEEEDARRRDVFARDGFGVGR
jgi:hypothetical protein